MNCFFCGAALGPGTFFCPECGRRVSEDTSSATSSGGLFPAAFGAAGRRAGGGEAGRTAFVAELSAGGPVAEQDEPSAVEADSVTELEPVDSTVGLHPAGLAPRPFLLVSTTGQRFEVTGRSLLGRKPAAAGDAAYDSVLIVDDPGKTVSKSHAELVVVAGELHVIDLESGNGTVVESPGEPPVRCTPGLPQQVVRGSRLILGRQAIDVG